MTPVVTWGLLVAWVVHDAEEFLAVPWWSAQLPGLQERHPRVPLRVWRLIAPGRVEAGVAIGVIGVVMTMAVIRGAGTAGRSEFFQVMLLGFGWHVLTHLAFSVLARGYTPGVVTAVLVAAPFSWWAWHRLGQAGLTEAVTASEVVLVLALLPLVLGGARGIGRLVESRVGSHGGANSPQ